MKISFNLIRWRSSECRWCGWCSETCTNYLHQLWVTLFSRQATTQRSGPYPTNTPGSYRGKSPDWSSTTSTLAYDPGTQPSQRDAVMVDSRSLLTNHKDRAELRRTGRPRSGPSDRRERPGRAGNQGRPRSHDMGELTQ